MEEPGSDGADGHDGQVQGDDKAAATTTTTTYRAYRRRYAMVLAVLLINVVSFGIHLGSALMCVGAVLRAVATSGLIDAASTQYAVSMVGQAVLSIGGPFLFTITTKVAQSWFPDDERILATTILVFASALGVSLAQVGSPLLVPETHQLPTLNYVYAGLAGLCELLTLVCVTRAKPPTPPSRSAAAQKVAGRRAPYLQQLRDILTCLPYLGLLSMHAVMVAAAIFLSMLTQQMLCSVGYTDLFSGAVVTDTIFFGTVGSVAFAVAVRRTEALTPIVKLAFAISVVSTIAFMELYLVPDQHALLLVVAALFGFFRNGMVPLIMEMSVETTYPVEETLSSALMSVTNSILGVLASSLIVFFASDPPDGLHDIEVCTDGLTSDLQAKDYSASLTGFMVVISVAVILFVPFFHTPYKRRLVEEHTAHAATTPTSTPTPTPRP